MTAKQLYRAKILRLAALAQNDSLFDRAGLFAHSFLNETAPSAYQRGKSVKTCRAERD